MKHGTIQIILLLIITFGAVARADAQKSSISSGGFIIASGQNFGTPVSTQSQIGQPINAGLNFGDVSPNGFAGRRVILKMPVRISAVTNYKVEAQLFASNGVSLKPADIGFGITNARAQIANSPNLNVNAAASVNPGRFGANPAAARNVGGKPLFQGTLADLSEMPTVLFTGSPTVVKGDLNEDECAILVDFIFVIVPQYFDPNDFSNLKMILTITDL